MHFIRTVGRGSFYIALDADDGPVTVGPLALFKARDTVILGLAVKRKIPASAAAVAREARRGLAPLPHEIKWTKRNLLGCTAVAGRVLIGNKSPFIMERSENV